MHKITVPTKNSKDISFIIIKINSIEDSCNNQHISLYRNEINNLFIENKKLIYILYVF